ncbi:uncharacterized protein LOC111630552 [Centruroides sculpturatus]|uniref:uncharacterized protein LOC111630552 n=1 Tax=Centruroides sculpturatus TaxID=218467 RepID=UPI000C6CDDB0|nr:uncharacterized protein LOC111630552 [Centruroides sculpturatus]
MAKFLLSFFILTLIPILPGNCALDSIIENVVTILTPLLPSDNLLSTLPEELKEIIVNITTGLPECLNSSTFPSLGCEKEIDSESSMTSIVTNISCLLNKVCYRNDTPNVVRVQQCLSKLFSRRVYAVSKDYFNDWVTKVYECIIVIYIDIRAGVTNCDLFNEILALNISSIANNLKEGIFFSTTSNLVTLLKILSGDMEARCPFPS